MTETELNSAVAKATGETVTTISQRGFVPLIDGSYDGEPQTVDWDEIEVTWAVRLTPLCYRISITL